MELHCLLTETPTTASSCSMDPLYDNCLPYAQRGRDREKEMETRVECSAVTRVSGPYGPVPTLTPAATEAPSLGGGRRGPGACPDHSYCSWRGGQGWETEPGVNRTRGGERGGGEQGIRWREEDRTHMNQNPSPSQSTQHRSALSLYDNLPEAVSPDNLQVVFSMETGFQEHLREQMYQAWAPEQSQSLMETEKESMERSPWSSCEIILSGSGSINQDQNPDQENKPEQEPELDSGSFVFKREEPVQLLHHQVSPLQPCQTGSQNLWPPNEAQPPEQVPWAARVPPPVPLADPSASALRSLLTSLQQQIVRQREEYEERIISLEQRNEELQVQVIRLKTNLAQQRHWYQIVQAKIVDSEKARVAAEERNATLQKEMEQFFDTFGELNNEAKKTEYIVKSF